MRQRRGAVLCSKCRQLIGVSERSCPHCGAVAPGLFGFAPALHRFYSQQLMLAEALTAVLVLLYTFSVLLDPRQLLEASLFSFGAPTSRSLYLLGMTGGLAWQEGLYWTVLSAVFLHGSLLHLLFNVSWLRNLVPQLTELIGPARTWALFVLSGVGGFVLSNLVSGAPTMGASGGIFGLFGALWVWGRRRGGTLGRAVSADALGWAVAGTVISLFMGGVNHWGHLGGLLTGAVVVRFFPLSRAQHETRAIQGLGVLLMVGTLLSLVLTPVVLRSHPALMVPG